MQEFDANSPPLQQQQNAAFTPKYVYPSGLVVSDTLQIGPLTVNQSVQVTKKVDPDFDYYGVDGSPAWVCRPT